LQIDHGTLAWEQEEARTVLLSIAIVAQSALIFSLRRLNKPIYKSIKEDNNWKIWPLILSVPIFHLMLMYLKPLDNALVAIGIQFELVQLGITDWVIILIMGLAPVGLLELAKLIWRKREKATKRLEATQKAVWT
jgi:magnesium-transporting ATPase (P-type)